MSEKVIKKQRNVAIELWRFIMAIAIIGFHAGFIIARSCNETTGFFMEVSNWFFGSSETLLVFTVTAGYFMAAHFTKRKNDPAYMSRSAAPGSILPPASRRCSPYSSSATSLRSSSAPASTIPTTKRRTSSL